MRYLMLVFMVFGCVSEKPIYENNYTRITNYPIQADRTTPHGVAIDQSGFSINLSVIDLIIDQAEQCLLENFREIALFCEDQKKICQGIEDRMHPKFWPCYDLAIGCQKYTRIKNGLDRQGFKIKIAPDWRLACDEQTMIFPCGIDPMVCINKNLMPSPECPCSCRSTIQDTDIITTPQFQVLAGEIVRLTTGFNNPWLITPIESCANIIP